MAFALALATLLFGVPAALAKGEGKPHGAPPKHAAPAEKAPKTTTRAPAPAPPPLPVVPTPVPRPQVAQPAPQAPFPQPPAPQVPSSQQAPPGAAPAAQATITTDQARAQLGLPPDVTPGAPSEIAGVTLEVTPSADVASAAAAVPAEATPSPVAPTPTLIGARPTVVPAAPRAAAASLVEGEASNTGGGRTGPAGPPASAAKENTLLAVSGASVLAIGGLLAGLRRMRPTWQ